MSSDKIRFGLIGFGYWGPNIARNINQNPNCSLDFIADSSVERRDLAAQQYPGINIVESGDEVFGSNEVDAVAIITPVATHFSLAKKALEAGKDVLLAKPLTDNSADAYALSEISKDLGKILMVDMTFLFTEPVLKIKEFVQSGELGELLYYDSVRINLGLFQSDVNVVWDLAPHDLSILDFITGLNPVAVSATGVSHYKSGQEDLAHITLFYENNFTSHFHVNWLSPSKIRKTIVGGKMKMLVWDDLSPENKLKVYDKGVELIQDVDRIGKLAEYRVGDMLAPALRHREALASEISYFVDCVRERKVPFNNAFSGARLVKILEAIDSSIRQKGSPIEITHE